VVHGSRAEVPQHRILVAGQEREARQLIALPFADLGRSHVSDIVDVEQKERATFRVLERLPCARHAVAGKPPKVDPALEIDRRLARRLDRPLPIPMRLDRTATGRLGDLARRDGLGRRNGFVILLNCVSPAK
jgi:hypothetical protein